MKVTVLNITLKRHEHVMDWMAMKDRLWTFHLMILTWDHMPVISKVIV